MKLVYRIQFRCLCRQTKIKDLGIWKKVTIINSTINPNMMITFMRRVRAIRFTSWKCFDFWNIFVSGKEFKFELRYLMKQISGALPILPVCAILTRRCLLGLGRLWRQDFLVRWQRIGTHHRIPGKIAQIKNYWSCFWLLLILNTHASLQVYIHNVLQSFLTKFIFKLTPAWRKECPRWRHLRYFLGP